MHLQKVIVAQSFTKRRATMIYVILGMTAVSLGLWLCVDHYLSPIPGMVDVFSRIAFAGKCCVLAVLFCFLPGVEAVAHERLQSPAIDPLINYETQRMKTNLRYLQNTLEQIILFSAGIFGLAYYCADGADMRAVVATTVIWILSRFWFWIGYHFGSDYRGFGVAGVAQSLIVLLYVGAKIGNEVAGLWGSVAILVTFSGIEAYLFLITRKPQPNLNA